MRFHLNDARRHRQAAKALTRAMQAIGIEMGLTGGLDWAARLYGYSDRHELDACLGKGPPGLWDEDESPGIVAARRERQLAVLAHAGVAPHLCAGILDVVRPTSRKASHLVKANSSAVPAALLDASDGPIRSDGNVLEFLDEWDRARAATEEERFRGMVQEAYGFRCRSIGIRVDKRRGVEATWGYRAGSIIQFAVTTTRRGVTEWLGLTRHGETIEVPHPDGAIPVAIYRSSDEAGFVNYSCRLVRNIAPAPTGLNEVGLADWETWDQAIRSSVGLHVLCVEGPHDVLVDAILARLEAVGVPGFAHRCTDQTQSRYLDPILSKHAPDVEVVNSHGFTRGKPKGVVILHVEKDADMPPDRIMGLALRSGQAVILLTSQGRPRDLIYAMLVRGVESSYLRATLRSTGEFHIVNGKAIWTMDICG